MNPVSIMKRIIAALLITSVAALSLLPNHAHAAETGHREITGYVQSYRNFLGSSQFFPLQSRVQVFDRDMNLILEVVTDESGGFSVSGLKPGTYTLIIQALNPRTSNGRFLPLTKSITLHRHDETVWNFVLHYIPD